MSMIIGLFVGYIISDKALNKDKETTGNQNNNINNDSTNNQENNQTASSTFKLSKEYQVTSNVLGELRMTVTIIDDKEMTISSGDGATTIEISKGTYSITDNILTYTRDSYEIGGEGWKKATNVSDFGDIDSYVEKFTIDKEKNQLELSNYSTRNFSNIVLNG